MECEAAACMQIAGMETPCMRASFSESPAFDYQVAIPAISLNYTHECLTVF